MQRGWRPGCTKAMLGLGLGERVREAEVLEAWKVKRSATYHRGAFRSRTG